MRMRRLPPIPLGNPTTILRFLACDNQRVTSTDPKGVATIWNRSQYLDHHSTQGLIQLNTRILTFARQRERASSES